SWLTSAIPPGTLLKLADRMLLSEDYFASDLPAKKRAHICSLAKRESDLLVGARDLPTDRVVGALLRFVQSCAVFVFGHQHDVVVVLVRHVCVHDFVRENYPGLLQRLLLFLPSVGEVVEVNGLGGRKNPHKKDHPAPPHLVVPAFEKSVFVSLDL